MKWNPFHKCEPEVEDKDESNVEKLEQELEIQKEKLAETKAKVPELAKAVASARRVHFQVDRFTEEMSRSFRRAKNE